MSEIKELLELRCNVDDMTGEAVAFAMDRLHESGALDVYTIPVGMKKNRVGVLICVTCRESDREAILQCLFKHTTTIGAREGRVLGYALDRRIETVDTEFGPVRRKVSSGYGVTREKYEYDDLARIAKEKGMSIEELLGKLK